MINIATRTFHPIGQGMFCSEQFLIEDISGRKLIFVYDCGTLTTKISLQAYVDEFCSSNDVNNIHSIYLSHLHEDHINGVTYLLEQGKIENMYIPCMDMTEKTFILLRCLFDYDGFLSDASYDWIRSIVTHESTDYIIVSGDKVQVHDIPSINVVAESAMLSDIKETFKIQCTDAQEIDWHIKALYI